MLVFWLIGLAINAVLFLFTLAADLVSHDVLWYVTRDKLSYNSTTGDNHKPNNK